MTHTDVQCHQYPHRSRCNSGGGRGWTSLETCECAPPLTVRGRMHEGGQSEIQQRNQLLWVFFNTRYTSTTNCILLLIKQLQTFEGGPVVRRLVRNETLPEVQRQWRPGKSCKLASYSLIWGCDCVSYPQYFHGISNIFPWACKRLTSQLTNRGGLSCSFRWGGRTVEDELLPFIFSSPTACVSPVVRKNHGQYTIITSIPLSCWHNSIDVSSSSL